MGNHHLLTRCSRRTFSLITIVVTAICLLHFLYAPAKLKGLVYVTRNGTLHEYGAIELQRTGKTRLIVIAPD